MKQKANDEAVQCLVEHTQKISAENKLLRKVFITFLDNLDYDRESAAK